MSFFNSKALILPALAVLAALPAYAAPRIQLTTDKAVYLQYEPIYLKIEKIDPLDPGVRVSPLEFDELSLEIQPPGASKYAYRPMMHACSFGAKGTVDEPVAYSTLVLSQGELITKLPGVYVLSLSDHDGNILAWPLNVTVMEPMRGDDLAARKIIEENPGEYGMFAYLEGGDHLVQGRSIFDRVAALNSGYRAKARAVMALNSTNDGIDVTNGRIKRKRDLSQFGKYFDGDGEEVPEYLKLKTGQMAVERFDAKQMPPEIRKQVRGIKSRFHGRNTPGFFRKVEGFKD